MSTKRANTEVNASLTQTSMGPISASTRAAACSTAWWSAVSTLIVRAWPPRSRTSRAAASRPALPRASSTTWSPSPANRRALARPMPPDAPVMTTTRGLFLGFMCSSSECWVSAGCAGVAPSPGAGLEALGAHPCLAQAVGGLHELGVDEGLGQVAAQLALDDVVLLSQKSRRPHGGAVALEPAQGVLASTEVEQSERHPEAAQGERALGLMQWPVSVLAEPVDVAVVGELLEHRSDRGDVSRVVCRDRAPDPGQEQGCVHCVVVG